MRTYHPFIFKQENAIAKIGHSGNSIHRSPTKIGLSTAIATCCERDANYQEVANICIFLSNSVGNSAVICSSVEMLILTVMLLVAVVTVNKCTMQSNEVFFFSVPQ